MARSVAQEARIVPFVLKARKVTMPAWDLRVLSCSPYSKSQSLMLASSEAVATRL